MSFVFFIDSTKQMRTSDAFLYRLLVTKSIKISFKIGSFPSYFYTQHCFIPWDFRCGLAYNQKKERKKIFLWRWSDTRTWLKISEEQIMSKERPWKTSESLKTILQSKPISSEAKYKERSSSRLLHSTVNIYKSTYQKKLAEKNCTADFHNQQSKNAT